MGKSRNSLSPRRGWTDMEIDLIRERYPHEPTQWLADQFRVPVYVIYSKAYKLGLRKSDAFNASPASLRFDGRLGGTTRFTPGITPWNKGTNFVAGGRSSETRFKQGNQALNTQPIGSYRVDAQGTLQRKINNNPGSNSVRWRGVHELVWIAANGPLPPKHIVVFKPGCRTTKLDEITIDRVECVSLADNMRRNSRHNLPKELSDLIQLRGALNRQINRRMKHHE